MSSPPAYAWRHRKRFSSNESAYFPAVTPSSSSVFIATGGTDTVAADAVTRPGHSNDGAPISVTSAAQKDGSIIESGSGNTAHDSAPLALA